MIQIYLLLCYLPVICKHFAFLLIQRAGIFTQTRLSYVIKFDNEAIFDCKHAKRILRSENKILPSPRRLKWRLVGLTCNACSYRDNAGRVESKATPVNVFIEGSRSSLFRLCGFWIVRHGQCRGAERSW